MSFLHTLFNRRGIFPITVVVVLSVLFVIAMVEAATTISTNITTDGNVTVTGNLIAKTGSTATFLVAANDASTRVKNQADYVADGTADDVQIQAAIDALPAGGGRVVLSEGTFNIATAIKYTSYITIQGQGYGWQTNGATILKPSADINIFDNTDNVTKYAPAFIGFTIDGDGVNRASGIGIRLWRVRWGLIRDVQIYRTKDQGILIDDDNTQPSESRGVENRISNVMLYQTGDDSIELVANGSSDNLFENITIRESQEHGLRLSTGGNQFIGCHIYASGDTTWEDNGAVGDGVIMGGNQNLFLNCQVESNALHGFLLSGATRNIFQGNSVFNNNRDGGATRYAFILTNNSDFNLIEGNFLTDVQGTPTQSGISLAAGNDNNSLLDNIIEIIAAGGTTIGNSGSGNIIRNNKGFVTENSATSTITSGNSTTTVSHGLDVTPSANDCSVTPTNNLGNASTSSFWADSFGASNFTINVGTDPGASTATFAWSCTVY